MALSAAERMRRYRMKRDQNPIKRSEYLKKEKERNETRNVPIAYETDRAKRRIRRRWRLRKSNERTRKQVLENLMTPPGSPDFIPLSPPPEQLEPKCHKAERRTPNESLQKQKRAKCYTKNAYLKQRLYIQQQKNMRLRKKLNRLLKPKDLSNTPRSKTKALMKTSSVKAVRRTLEFHHALVDEIKAKYATGGNKFKRSLSLIISGNILKKYRFRCAASTALGVSVTRKCLSRLKKTNVSRRLLNKIQSFFQRPEVSRLVPGKKQTVTKFQVKKQKHLLKDTLKNTYLKFTTENIHDKIGYSTFCRLKPFWVRFPTEKDRLTCLCKTHENMQLLVEKLHTLEILDKRNPDDVLKQFACNTQDKMCMYGMCQSCEESKTSLHKMDVNLKTTWYQWKIKKQLTTMKHGGETEKKELSITVKEEQSGTVGELLDIFYEQMRRYKIHYFNICNQHAYYQSKVKEMNNKECLIHVDFAENFLSKMSAEVQSMHFGASKQQITLHTGVYYIGSDLQPNTFCTVSDSLNHGPKAVWAHMMPVLKRIREEHPHVETINFFSDGPVTQYRQKGNFYLCSVLPFELGFKSATWNFHEAGHGKGVPDGVGASLKRSADQLVLHGRDILDAESFVKEIQATGTTIQLYHVSSEAVAKSEKIMDAKTLPVVPGTMRLHQLITENQLSICYRDVSCNCRLEAPCPGHNLTKFIFPIQPNKSMQRAFFENVKVEGKKSKVLKKSKTRGTGASNREAEDTPKNVAKSNHSTNREKNKPHDADKFKKIYNLKPLNHREHHFAGIISSMIECKSYENLKVLCSALDIDNVYPLNLRQNVIILNTGLNVDINVMDQMPNDIPGAEIVYPAEVSADGNCLPHSASVFAFGSQNHDIEMRTRIVHELTMHDDLYLSQAYLSNGIQNPTANLPKQYAMYSENFIPGIQLTTETIKTIYENEVLGIRMPQSFMGIWQLFSLSSVLKTPIFSVYPQKGNMNVRKDLHRIIFPRYTKHSENKCVMWCSTRQDMLTKNWIPNHFTPLLPIEIQQNKKDATPQNLENYVEHKDDVVTLDEDDVEHKDHVVTLDEDDVEHKDDVVTLDEDDVEHKDHVVTLDEDNVGNSNDQLQYSELFELNINEFLDKLVCVSYEGMAYPGKVIDVEGRELYIECMHYVGRETNMFFWPRMRDRCWYILDNILAIIPVMCAEENVRHYSVPNDIWNMCQDRLTSSMKPKTY